MGLASLVVLGVAAQWVAWRLGLPSILLLLATGFAAGPALGILDPDALLGDLLLPAVSLAVAVILFEGGLSLDLRDIRGHGPVVTRLVTLGALVTWVLAALAARYLAALPWSIAILLGAILTVTGPTVIAPLLRHVRPKGDSGPILRWEGILIDPVGALLALVVFEALVAGSAQEATSRVVLAILSSLAAGALVGLAGAALLYVLLRRRWLPEHLDSPITLALVLLVFVVADVLQSESGLFAVTLMGVLLANQRSARVHHIVEFKENLTVLILAVLFVTLAARLRPEDLQGLGDEAALMLAALMLVVRPAAVALSTWGSKLAWRERAFLAWMAPRGIVAAAVASIFALRLEEAGVEGADRLVPLTFFLIVMTVGVYGLTARPLAGALGLGGRPPQGALVVGASRFPRALAKALRAAGQRALLVDTNLRKVLAAREEGLEATAGNVMDDALREALDLDGLGRLVAATPNDDVNRLASLAFATEEFGRQGVYQLASAPAGTPERAADEKSPLRGQTLFAPDATLAALEARMEAGDEVHLLDVPRGGVDLARLAGPSGEPALPLFTSTDGGLLRFATVTAPLQPRPGMRLAYLGGSPPPDAA